MNENEHTMLTVQEVATRLNLSCQCVYALIEAGKLAAHRFGVGRGTIRVSEADLAAFITESRKEINTPQAKKTQSQRLKLKHIKLPSASHINSPSQPQS